LILCVLRAGLEKPQVLLKKPEGRLNAGFVTGFSGQTGFELKMSIFGGKDHSHSATLLKAT